MTLDEAVAELERGRTVSELIGYRRRDGTRNPSRAPNGVRYATVVSGGIKAEGEDLPGAFPSIDEAVDAWAEAARIYALGATRIYWRMRPTVEQLPARGRRPAHFFVYSRFAVARGGSRARKEEGHDAGGQSSHG